MNKLKSLIVDYYDSLMNQIDIHCENLLADTELEDTVKEEYGKRRTRFLDEIKKIEEFNLNHLKSIRFENEHVAESVIFDGKFCFFIPRTKKDVLSDFGSDRFGKLVLTNQFISNSICENLVSVMNGDAKKNDKMSPKETISEILLEALLEKNMSATSDVVDFSITEKNFVDKFHMTYKRGITFSDSDFNVIETFIPIENIRTCSLRFPVSRKILSKFEKAKKLIVSMPPSIESDFFSDLKDLESLTVAGMASPKIPAKLFNGLENLKELTLYDNEIESLETKPFASLKRLENLHLAFNQISKLKKVYFQGLENLKYLNLEENPLESIDVDTFEGLNNLTCLNLRYAIAESIKVDFLKSAQNLQFVSLVTADEDTEWLYLDNLNLPSLKYVAINSIREFKHLKPQCLGIDELEDLDANTFKGYEHLRGLVLRINSNKLKSIKPEYFSCLKNLAYLRIDLLDEPSNLQKQRINDEKFYKKFISKPQVYLRTCFNFMNYFEVSSYEKTQDFFCQELNVSDDVFQVIVYSYLGIEEK